MTRICSDPLEPTYYQHVFASRRIIITLDGREMRDVVEADDELGYVILFDRDSDDRLQLDGGCVRTKRLEGVVEIIGRRWPAGAVFREPTK